MRLHWTARARADLSRIWLFLAERDLEVADRITKDIEARCDRLVDHLRMAPVVMRNVRQWSMPNIGYIATYVIEGDQLRIMRILHAREHREQP